MSEWCECDCGCVCVLLSWKGCGCGPGRESVSELSEWVSGASVIVIVFVCCDLGKVAVADLGERKCA